MKNTMRKLNGLLAAVMTAALTAGTSISVSATDTGTIAVKNETQGYTYETYQIFEGDYYNGKLSNIVWGSGVTAEGQTAIYSRYNLTGSNQTAEKAAEAVVNDSSSDQAHELAKLLETTTDALTSPTSLTYSESIVINSQPAFKGYKAENLNTGYYLILNKSVPNQENQVYSDYIVELVNDVAVEPKCEKPESIKKVKDTNDTTANLTLSDPMDSADYEIGDVIPFTVTVTLPDDYADYETYYLKLEDDMSAGLTLDTESVEITYGATTLPKHVEMTKTTDSSYPGGCVFSYVLEDLRSGKPNLTAGDVITLEYSVTLNKNAVTGSAGNPNKFRIEYSNDKNHSQSDNNRTTTTPWDVNTVFTYKTVFNKVDGNNQPLTGADFRLEKKIGTAYTDVTTLGSGTNHPLKTGDSTGSAFVFSGLDDGDYRLVETVTPAGYNQIQPIEFTITASHDVLSDSPALTSLTGTGEGLTLTSNLSEGSLTAQIVNKSGVQLPSTGGMGTGLFRISGILLIVGTGIFLVLAKRRRKESQ